MTLRELSLFSLSAAVHALPSFFTCTSRLGGLFLALGFLISAVLQVLFFFPVFWACGLEALDRVGTAFRTGGWGLGMV